MLVAFVLGFTCARSASALTSVSWEPYPAGTTHELQWVPKGCASVFPHEIPGAPQTQSLTPGLRAHWLLSSTGEWLNRYEYEPTGEAFWGPTESLPPGAYRALALSGDPILFGDSPPGPLAVAGRDQPDDPRCVPEPGFALAMLVGAVFLALTRRGDREDR